MFNEVSPKCTSVLPELQVLPAVLAKRETGEGRGRGERREEERRERREREKDSQLSPPTVGPPAFPLGSAFAGPQGPVAIKGLRAAASPERATGERHVVRQCEWPGRCPDSRTPRAHGICLPHQHLGACVSSSGSLGLQAPVADPTHVRVGRRWPPRPFLTLIHSVFCPSRSRHPAARPPLHTLVPAPQGEGAAF